jgi:hypothetical protein
MSQKYICMLQPLSIFLPLSLDQLRMVLRQLPADEKKKLIRLLQEETQTTEADPVLTHFASEQVLAKDWDTPEEDQVWQHL